MLARRRAQAGAQAAGAGFVLRVEQRLDGRCRYQLQDLRSGELHQFRRAMQLLRWLRRGSRVGLK